MTATVPGQGYDRQLESVRLPYACESAIAAAQPPIRIGQQGAG